VLVPGGGSTDVHYTCTYLAAPTSSTGTNTAEISWPDIGSTANTATASAEFNFDDAAPTIVDGSANVTDTLGGTLGTVKYSDASPTTYNYSHTFSGDPGGTCTDHNNTATSTTNTTGKTDDASQKVTVCVGADLTASKTALPAFTRTYLWNIAKAVDRTHVDQVGGTVTFNYTVTVRQTGFTDSGWGVTGTITV